MTDTTYEEAARRAAAADSCELPAYMRDVYDWAYVNPAWVRWLDHNLVVRTLLFLNDQRLMRRYLDRIRPGMRVWQVAHVYGDLVTRAARRAGSAGCLHVTDVTPIQLEHARQKLQGLPCAQVIPHDAADFRGVPGQAPYDLICSFMLLHEVPDSWKRRIVDNILNQLPANGEALFVDYHRPALWQPVGYILRLVNRLLEPFAPALWQHEISHFASAPERFVWQKETLFGGVYQIVSVRPVNGQ